MQESRLIKYIQELSAKDRERFHQFVFSPYFNQHEKTRELLEIIYAGLEAPERELGRVRVFTRLFPGEDFDEQQLYNVMSYLKKLYHRFLSFEFFEKRQFQEPLYTLEAAFDKNQFDLLKNRSKQLEKSLRQCSYNDSEYYNVNYHLNRMQGYYTSSFEDRSKTELFQKMLDYLDKYYIAEKLRNCCHLTANMMMMNTQYEMRFLEDILQYIRRSWDFVSDDPTIIMYYTILMSLREENKPEHYQHLKEMLANNFSALSPQDGRDLYQFAYNYCIRKLNLAEDSYRWELFHLYKQGLKNGILLSNDILSEWDYKNITTLGCSLKEFEWTEDFIQEYKDKLPANKRENAYNYNLANLYYNKKMYNEALSALLLVQFSDIKYHLSTNFLLLRTYYEMKDTEALLSLIETSRIYVIRNRKITTDEKRGYTNFLRFAKKLVLLRHHASTYNKKVLKEKLDHLTGRIEDSENVTYKFWLLEECRA